MTVEDLNRVTIAIEGSGIAALHVVARLPEMVAKDSVVIDDSGEWLTRWFESGDKRDIRHLRVPITVHPHNNPLALKEYALKKAKAEELVTMADRFAPVPSWRLFKEFCSLRVQKHLPKSLARVVKDTVLELQPIVGQGMHIHLASGKSLAAQVVIYTAAPTQPVLPNWANQLQQSLLRPPACQPSQRSKTKIAATTACKCNEVARESKGGVSRQAGPVRSLPAKVLTWDQVDMRSAQLASQHVVIVGGGMTSALLAQGAAARGALVTLICRRKFSQQPFACEVGWWGNKCLRDYLLIEEPIERLKACRKARQQASIDVVTWRQLVALAAAGKLVVIEEAEVANASYVDAQTEYIQKEVEGLIGGSEDLNAHCQLLLAVQRSSGASNNTFSLHGKTPVPSPFQSAAAAATNSNSTPLSGSFHPLWQLGYSCLEQGKRISVRADALWIACGSTYNMQRDPVLAQLQRQQPTHILGGYPLIDDATLAWPGAPVFLVGRAAMLSVGPCAGDLGGMRLAAAKVVAALKRLHYPGDPAWVEAERKLADLRFVEGAAATIPSEETGDLYLDSLPKTSVLRPAHLIDISDVDSRLPRQELQQYKFTDTDFEICVILQLPEAVPLDHVRTNFQDKSLEMWAIGEQAAYRLHIPQLYGKVVAKKCKAKVNTKLRKVFLLLYKESDAEWRFLKS